MSHWDEEIERRRSEARRHRENSARMAVVRARFTTTGWGEREFDLSTDFGLTFVEEPVVSYGFALDGNKTSTPGSNNELVAMFYPRASGFVTDWDRDARDHPIGAWCAVVVDHLGYLPDYDDPARPDYKLVHHFRFEGVAIKDLPLGVS